MRYNPRHTELTWISVLISCTPVQHFSGRICRIGPGGTNWGATKEDAFWRRRRQRQCWNMADSMKTTQRKRWAVQKARAGWGGWRSKAATSQRGPPKGRCSNEQVAGRQWLSSAAFGSHMLPLLPWSVTLCLVPSSLHFRTKLPPPCCPFCSVPSDSPQRTSLCLATTTPSLGDCFLFWEPLIWFTSSNEESAHISSPSLTSICQICSQRLLMKAVSQHP